MNKRKIKSLKKWILKSITKKEYLSKKVCFKEAIKESLKEIAPYTKKNQRNEEKFDFKKSIELLDCEIDNIKLGNKRTDTQWSQVTIPICVAILISSMDLFKKTSEVILFSVMVLIIYGVMIIWLNYRSNRMITYLEALQEVKREIEEATVIK